MTLPLNDISITGLFVTLLIVHWMALATWACLSSGSKDDLA